MNKSLILILFLLYSLHFAAQTFEVPFISQPDTLVKTMLPFHDAGAAGRDLTWDFKSLSLGEDLTPIYGTSEFVFSFLLPIVDSKMPFDSMSIVNSILNGQLSFGLSGAFLFGVSISFDINFFYNN